MIARRILAPCTDNLNSTGQLRSATYGTKVRFHLRLNWDAMPPSQQQHSNRRVKGATRPGWQIGRNFPHHTGGRWRIRCVITAITVPGLPPHLHRHQFNAHDSPHNSPSSFVIRQWYANDMQRIATQRSQICSVLFPCCKRSQTVAFNRIRKDHPVWGRGLSSGRALRQTLIGYIVVPRLVTLLHFDMHREHKSNSRRSAQGRCSPASWRWGDHAHDKLPRLPPKRAFLRIARSAACSWRWLKGVESISWFLPFSFGIYIFIRFDFYNHADDTSFQRGDSSFANQLPFYCLLVVAYFISEKLSWK